MNRRTILFILIFFISGLQCFAQEQENVKNKGIDNQLTISEVDMYQGTKSEKAKKYFNQAAESGDNGDFENAKKLYLKAIKEDDTYVEAYDNLGLAFRRIGDFDNAIKYYKKSIQLYPEGRTAHQNLAVVYSITKDYKNSINEYDELVKMGPNDPEGYFGLANCYMMLSQFDDALAKAQKALELYKETNAHHIGDGYYMVGLISYYKGETKDAKQYIQLAKDNGAKIHPQIEEEVLQSGSESEFQLETDEDFARLEPEVIKAYNWLMENPIGVEPESRKELNSFLLKWITGSPNVSIELTENIVGYTDCGECLMMFMGGWTKYAIESKDANNKVNGSLEGTKSVIQFYQKNRKALGKNKAIEKLIRMQDKGKLEDFIRSNI